MILVTRISDFINSQLQQITKLISVVPIADITNSQKIIICTVAVIDSYKFMLCHFHCQ